MKPTIGRIVHFHVEFTTAPAAAVIVGINPDGTLNLSVWNDRGEQFPVLNICAGGPDANTPTPGCWTWPPLAPLPAEKALSVTSVEDAKAKVSDIVVVGNGDTFQLLCKASSKSQGWMKSAKAMQLPGGCVVQVTTQQGSNVAEAICYVPGVMIKDDVNGGRYLGEKVYAGSPEEDRCVPKG